MAGSYAGGTGTVVGGVDTKIPFPNKYGDLADAPGILEDRSLAIYNLVKEAVTHGVNTGIAAIPPPKEMGETEFQALLDKFIQAKASRVATPVLTFTAAGTDYDTKLLVTSPEWKSQAVIDFYLNLDGVSAAGEIKVTVKAGAKVIAYHEQYISTTGTGNMFHFTFLETVDPSQDITVLVQRAGLNAATVGTRFMNIIFYRLTAPAAFSLAGP